MTTLRKIFLLVIFCGFFLSLTGCQQVMDQVFTDEVKQEIADTVKEEAEKAVEAIGEEIKDQAGEILEGAKTDIEEEIKSLEPQLYACAISAVACPKQTDAAMGSEWKQVTAVYQNSADKRNKFYYMAVINQFKVETSYACRYRPSPDNGCTGGTSDTRCNIFAADVMRAMGSPLPTKGELGVGRRGYERTDPMTANVPSLHKWLLSEPDGWQKVDINDQSQLNELLAHLLAGKPGVVLDDDHIAVLRPDQTLTSLDKSTIGKLLIAQSGAILRNSIQLDKIAGGQWYKGVDIFIHD